MENFIGSQPVNQSLNYKLGFYTLYRFRFLAQVAYAPLTCYLQEPSLLDGMTARFGKRHVPHVITALPISVRLRKVQIVQGCIRYAPAQYQRYYVEFSGTFADYVRKFSPKARYNMNRAVRKLAALNGGSVDFREYRLPEEMPEFYRLASD